MKKIIPFLVFCLVATCNAELRTWTAVNGKEVEAEFVSNSDGQVTLKLKSGKVFEVPLDKLSELDQKFLKAKSYSGLLAENIVGRLITFESDNGLIQLLFNEDGVMMHGDGGDLKDLRLTYKIEGNEVLVFEEEERDGGISFSSSSPKVGDQVEMGPKKRIESAKITKIENAPQTAVNSSTEKQQKLNEEVKPEEPLAETKPELEGVNRDELEEREGIIYLKGSDTPYTGKFFVLRKNGQKEGEANFKDGKYDGLWVAWHKNGKKGAEKNFKDGKLISEKYWNDKGEPVESERQALGNNEEAISKATEASIAKSLNSMKQLTLALFSYARDHDERFPASLEDLIPDYLDDRFKSYLSMMCTDGSRKPWHYVAGITTESEADKVILYSPEPIEGKWLVGFVDGSVSTMEEVEFRALVKDSKKKLK